ncbi:MAG: TIGR00730 family Rossman fold protein [Muribaculaceae bacterium]|nr:TIGR00730 family Rossman fold protein [Muribaculaceae bacterium]
MAFEKINICVFGASSRNLDKSYVEDSYLLGTLMAQRGWRCLNGAGSEGLMRAVSDGALDAGGEAIGVIPQFMIDNGWHYERLTSIIATPTMHERKSTLARMSQAVIALPGGCGTMEELLEAITWRQLNLMPKPIILLNTLGFYDNLVAMLNHAIEHGFMKASHHRLWKVAQTPAQALDIIEQELSHDIEPAESKY